MPTPGGDPQHPNQVETKPLHINKPDGGVGEKEGQSEVDHHENRTSGPDVINAKKNVTENSYDGKS